MGWEKRRGRLYYYQSVRDGKRVRKVYLGTGWMADTLARGDRLIRRIREEEVARQKVERERIEALIAPVAELDEVSHILTKVHLAAAGYHRHKGQWRKARAQRIA